MALIQNARLLSSAATTNATLVKSSGGSVTYIIGYNARASAVYLKLYDKATAPTVGTDVPVITVYLPTAAAFGIEIPHEPQSRFQFINGIGFALTALGADNDATAIAAADILALNVMYL